MSENIGRLMTLAIGTDGSEVVLTGVRTKSFTINSEPVDITNDSDAGWRDLLSEPGQKSVDFSVEGVTVDSVALAAAINATDISTNILLTFPLETGQTTAASIECDGVITSYAETGAYNDAITFSLELQSRGAVTFTAAAP